MNVISAHLLLSFIINPNPLKPEQPSRKHGIPNSNTSVLRFSVVLVAILFSSHLNDPIVVNYIIIFAHNTYVEALYSLSLCTLTIQSLTKYMGTRIYVE